MLIPEAPKFTRRRALALLVIYAAFATVAFIG